jgi:hypothetical protein
MTTENYRSETRDLAGVKINLTSYKIGDRFYCHVSNLDPGATIARAEAASSGEAESLALSKAAERLKSKSR